MSKKEKTRIATWGLTVEIISEGPTIYLKGQSIKEAKNILYMDEKLLDEVKNDAINMLNMAQECNASLQEIRSYPTKGTMRFSFEFESWEIFMRFKTIIEELPQK